MKKLCCRGIDIEVFSLQLIFDNYTTGPHSSAALPAASCSKRSSAVEYIGGSSSAAQNEDLDELRQQLQSMKKQTLVIMEQSRRSSENEKRAVQQAQEAIALKETAVAEAAEATRRENHMLELMNDASLDMTGMLRKIWSYVSLTLLSFIPC
jgi:prophage DNA circulation protein